MSSDVVMISNKSYIIKQSLSDRTRRRLYFNTFKENSKSSYTLTSDESRLLSDLGIDSKMLMNLKLYLPTFFDNIQICGSDSSLILRKDCNIPYYVLWSIMFANKHATDKRIQVNKEAYYSTKNIGVALNTSIISQMHRKNIRDEYDTLFELLLTRDITLSDSNESLFVLPVSNTNVVQVAKKEVTLPIQQANQATSQDQNVNIEYAQFIPEIFTLIVTTPGAISKLEMLVKNRVRPPLYTFSQLGSTCASDALFTILLQADNIGDIFIKNAQKIKDEHLDPIITNALSRYERMLELESEHVHTSSKGRRTSLNLNTRYGEAVLHGISGTDMKDDKCIGLRKSNIIEYIKDIQHIFITNNIIQDIKELNVFYGTEFNKFMQNSTSNLHSVKGIYLHIPGNITQIGHAISFVKIYDEWYLSDNEHGMLHKISDIHLINLLLLNLYKQRTFTINYQKHLTENLSYRFEFYNDDNKIVYKYPNLELNPDPDSVSQEMTPSRVLIFTHEIEQGGDDKQMNKIISYFDKNIDTYIQNEL
jgi:hypothetical protein